MSCAIYPQVKNKQGEFVDSELFKQLLSLTKDREMTKTLYLLSLDLSFRESNKDSIKLDDNNEVTIDSFNSILDMNEFISDKAKISQFNKELQVDKLYSNLEDILPKVTKFNRENPNYVASISKDSGKYRINISTKTDENFNIPNEILTSIELNKHLINILKTIGVSVDVNSDYSKVNGIFDPLNATTNAEGLKTMISIAKGERGQEALSEEFSHLIIEALGNEPFIQRTLSLINSEEVIKEILGEDFDFYNSEYKGNFSLLQKEAAGKILDRYIKGVKDNLVEKNKGFLDRVWAFIKRIFSKLNVSDINNTISQINENISTISDSIKDGSIIDLLDTERASRGERLFKVNKDVISLEEITNKTLENLVKRYKIYQDRKKGKDFSVEEKKKIKELQSAIATKNYIGGLTNFLKDAMKWMNDANKRMDDIYSLKDSLNSPAQIRYTARQLRDLRDFIGAYKEPMSYIAELAKNVKRGDISIEDYTIPKEIRDVFSIEDSQDPMEVIEIISELALTILSQMNSIMKDFDNISFAIVHTYFKEFFGEDKLIPFGKDKGKILTLEMVMNKTDKDISFINRFLDSAADSGDMMISMFDKAVKSSKFNSRILTEQYIHRLREIYNTLKEVHGIDNVDFMYEMDSKNVPTGYFISERSYSKYEEAKKKYEDSIILDPNLPEDAQERLIHQWERDNTEMVLVDSDLGRWERMPKQSLYPSNSVRNLSAPQREYYDEMMLIKKEMDAMLPLSRINKYKAPQIRTTSTETILSNINSPKKAFKTFLDSVKDDFLRREDDTDFGQLEDNEDKGYSTVSTQKDFRGNRVQKLPIYYTSMLTDKTRLSKDATANLAAYASSAIEFNEMNKVIDVLELGRDIMREREVVLNKAGKKLREGINALGVSIKSELTNKGSETNVMNRLDDLFSMLIYGELNMDEGTLFGTKLDQAKTLDNLKNYTAWATLGLNIFSGLNNVMVGKYQLLLEGIAGEYFNVKDIAIADKNYTKILPEYLSEIGSTKMTSRLGLLRELFDIEQNADIDAKHQEFYKSTTMRIFGGANVMFLQSAGEHYMSTRTLLAYMNNYKVKDSTGKEITLYDAFEVKKVMKQGKLVDAHLDIKEGVTKLDGSKFGLDDIKEITLKVAKINQSLHGIYNRADKSAIQKWALGRLALMFRKWMTPHVNRRLKGVHYDGLLDQWREGFYQTSRRFLVNIFNEVRANGMSNIPIVWKGLDNHEKANIIRALSEVSFFIGLSVLLGALGDWTEADTWAERMLQYQLRRLRLELGVSIPGPMMLTEATTILQSPSAAMSTGLDIINMMTFTDLFTEIEHGKYAGHSVYYRNAEISMPVIGNIRKMMDLKDEQYMFNMFK